MSAQNMLHSVDTTLMNRWVDSVMLTLNADERLGQLIMPIVDSRDDDAHRQIIRQDIETYHVGGLLFSKGTIGVQAKTTKYARKLSKKAPLWIAMDGEWGISMRMTDAILYPRNGVLGTINPDVRDSIMYAYGLETARQCRLLGVNINFAPVLDINSNPANPVIGNRSFGATVWDVIPPALSYSRGLEDGGIMAVGKHFPGHGDTDTDSHKTLPLLRHDRQRMIDFECMPFRYFAKAGFGGIMAAHLEIPSLDSVSGLPSSLSHAILTDLLKDQFGFSGLVFTDGLAMKGVNSIPNYSVKALLAGVDVLLDPVPLKREWASLKAAVKSGELPQQLIDEKCRRVLQWKYVLCVCNAEEIDVDGLKERINTPEAKALLDLMNKEIEKAKNDTTRRQHTVKPDNFDRLIDPTEQGLPDYDPTEQTLPGSAPMPDAPQPVNNPAFHRIDSLVLDALDHNAFPGCQILVAQHGKIIYNKAFGWLDEHRSEPNSLLTRYDLASVSKASATLPALMLAMGQHNIKLNDRLDWHIPQLRKTGKQQLTLRQTLLHETGMRDGYNFYAMTIDSASVDGRHYSGKSIPPYTVQQDKRCWFHKNLRFDSTWISSRQDTAYSLQVARNMYIRPQFRDSMLQKIIDLPLKGVGQYRYSCLNFVLLRILIENATQMSMDSYLEREMPEFFGAEHLCFNPLQHGVDPRLIAPTENDQALRHQLLRGYVHDETAAWSGGVEGNAGLFGSATDLYPVLQMMLNGGEYDGKRYIDADICKTFTNTKSRISRRGLGFDKPETNPKKRNPCADECSPATWGHTGYTGTCFWVDPKLELVYIFLCNRVCPHRWNTTLTQESYRTRIQSFIYEAIK